MRLPIAMTAVSAIAAIAFALHRDTEEQGAQGLGRSRLRDLDQERSSTRSRSHQGAYTHDLTIQDKSAFHNFHLTGPGINKAYTAVPFTGTKKVTVKLKVGKYTFLRPAQAPDEGVVQGTG